MKTLTLIILLCASITAHALDCGSNSARIKGKLIVRGDSGAVVSQLRPDSRARIENRYGAGIGVRYDFHNGRRVVQVYVTNGVVSAICRG